MNRLVFGGVLAFVVIGCPKDAPPAPRAPEPAPTAPGAVLAPPRTGPEKPEPQGISAGSKKLPDATGNWVIDAAGTSVSFTIVSNSAGPITGRFPGGAAGALDDKTKKGVFSVDVTTLSTVNRDGAANALRDTNVIEAFFGARPFANAQWKAAVDEAWKPLAGKIANGVTKAGFVVDAIEGPAAALEDGTSEATVRGRLVLWESVEVPLKLAVSVTKTGDTIEVKGKEPATFNIEDIVGTSLRQALFTTMLAAGCAHQPGIQDEVSVMLESVRLVKK